jgi:hypothetical protein
MQVMPQRQRLIYRGKELLDNQILKDIGVEEGCIVHFSFNFSKKAKSLPNTTFDFLSKPSLGHSTV